LENRPVCSLETKNRPVLFYWRNTMKKSLLIAMRGLMALMAVAPLLAGCGEKSVEPGKNDTPEIKEQRGQKAGD